MCDRVHRDRRVEAALTQIRNDYSSYPMATAARRDDTQFMGGVTTVENGAACQIGCCRRLAASWTAFGAVLASASGSDGPPAPAFVFFVLVWIWILGIGPAFWVVYFRNGLRTVKRVHRVDWRQFLGSNVGFWLSHVLFWPVAVVGWFANGRPAKSMAAVEVDGIEQRTFVSTAEYSVIDGIAR